MKELLRVLNGKHCVVNQVLHHENVIAIPRSGRKEHVLENWNVREISLEKEDLEAINLAFPAPKRKVPLDIV